MEPTPVTCSSSCTVTYVVQAPSPEDYASLGFDSVHIAKAMGFGLGFVLLLWSLGYVCSVAVTAVKKV